MRVCFACGYEAAEAFKFCPECGAAAAPSGEEHRKVVTVLFCDVVGSTALGESTDPETLRTLLARYFERMKQIVERHGGTVEKFIGDAVMAVFGVPLAHEDDALRACRAAVEMREAFRELSVQGRIGVMTGEVVTGTEERLATGDAVNVAARLQQAAQPGDVLIGEPALALVRDAVEALPVQPLTLKGKSEPVTAFRLLAVRDAVERRHEARFVGRDEELAVIEAAWGRAQAEERCELVTVIGEAGVGKSRLVGEALARIGTRVVQGRCLPYGEGITYWPVVEVIKQLDVLPSDEAAAAAIRSLLGETSVVASADEIGWAFRKLLEESAPLIVVFDDVQWGDDTYLDLLEHVALLSSGAAILVLCMARPELVERRTVWPVTLRLEPLPEDAVDELIGKQVTGGLRERIARAAGGNPLFISEILAMAKEADGQISVPPTLKALLSARLDQLDPAERRVLERGAVEGEIFHRGAVQALVLEERQVMPRLAALVRKELVRPDRAQLPGEDGFRFRHVLIRDTAYDQLPKSARAELHERFALWLEPRGAGLVELDEIVGYHLEQAYRYRTELGSPDDGLAERAGMRLAAAASRALVRGDRSAGTNLALRAADLLPQEAPDRTRLLADAGAALIEAGDLARAEPLLSEAIEAARATGQRSVELRARLDRSLGRELLGTQPWEAFVDDVDAAMRELERLGDDGALAKGWRIVAHIHLMNVDGGAMQEALERSIEHARLAGDRRQELESLDWLVRNCWFGPRTVDEGIRLCNEVLEYPEPGVRSIALQVLGVLHGMRGDFERARDLIDRARAIQLDLGMTLAVGAGTSMMGGHVEVLAGDAVRAEERIRWGEKLLAPTGETGFRSTLFGWLAEALYRQGRFDEAEEAAREANELGIAEDVETQRLWRGVRGKVLARRGDFEQAERLGREAVEFADRTDSYIRADARLDLAEVLRIAGRRDEAAKMLREAVALYDEKGMIAGVWRAETELKTLSEM